ncbi:MAG TPA: hypothetical protein VFB16_12560 [Bauldia sp.]|nr:hypothetical protein [Bauldia sp.]
MRRTDRQGRRAGLLAAAVLAAAGTTEAMAEDIRFEVAHSLRPDQPFTVIYPDFMVRGATLSGSAFHLDYPGHPLQCEVLVRPDTEAGWTAEHALSSFDVASAEAMWRETFPRFEARQKGLTSFQSGPAFLYWGETGENPSGVPLNIYRAEAVDAGRLYVVECFVPTANAAELLNLVTFLIRNFSTRPDAECCIDPRGAE